MDNTFIHFTNYLMKIGFLSNSNIEDFKKTFISQSLTFDNSTITSASEKYYDSILKQDKISSCVVDFLNLLNNDRKKLLGISLFTKFYEYNLKQKLNSSKVLFYKYRKMKIIPFFKIWKNLTESINFLKEKNYKNTNLTNIVTLQSKKVNNNNVCYIEKMLNKNKNNSNSFKNYKNLLKYENNKKPNDIIKLSTYNIKKEEEELRECTFKPKINNYNPFLNKSNSKQKNKEIIEKLYSDNKKKNNKNQIELEDKKIKNEKELTFKPNLISKSPKKIKKNFNERLKSFDDQKIEDLNRLKNKYENNFSSIYTFSPDISKSQKSISKSFSTEKLNIPVYERLYINSEERKRKKLLKEKEINLEIKNLSNSQFYNNKNYDNSKINSSIDYKKIEELYNDYKKFQNKILQKRIDLDIEQGLTFQPEIYSNRKYYDKINNNFERREQIHLNKKYQNIQNNHNLKDENSTSRRYTKREKEEIANNIINKLYKIGVEKYKQRKLSADNCDKRIKNKVYSKVQNQNLIQENINRDNNYDSNKNCDISQNCNLGNLNNNIIQNNELEQNVKYIYSPSPIKYTKTIRIKINK